MLNLKRLSTQEDFNNIKEHDYIVIEFQDEYADIDNIFNITKGFYYIKHLNGLIINKKKIIGLIYLNTCKIKVE